LIIGYSLETKSGLDLGVNVLRKESVGNCEGRKVLHQNIKTQQIWDPVFYYCLPNSFLQGRSCHEFNSMGGKKVYNAIRPRLVPTSSCTLYKSGNAFRTTNLDESFYRGKIFPQVKT